MSTEFTCFPPDNGQKLCGRTVVETHIHKPHDSGQLCDWRGFEAFESYVWSGVVTYNLVVIARHLLE